MKMNGVIVNENGNVKTEARKTIATYVANHRDIFAKATANENGTYSIPVEDNAGNVVFINFTVTVGAKNAADRVEKKRAKKERVVETFGIEG